MALYQVQYKPFYMPGRTAQPGEMVDLPEEVAGPFVGGNLQPVADAKAEAEAAKKAEAEAKARAKAEAEAAKKAEAEAKASTKAAEGGK
jgi:hypothetical protein